MNKQKIDLENDKILRSENVEYNGDTLKKHLDEQKMVSGSNSNGNYIKFPDGTMICTKTVIGTTSITVSWGSLYESPIVPLGDFALPFTETPKVFANNSIPSGKTGNGFFIEWIDGTTNTSFGSTILVRPSQESKNKYNIDLFAIGRWK